MSSGDRAEQDFQIKPCHFASYWPFAPPWQVLTVVLPWQLPIWGLGKRGSGQEVRRWGEEMKSSVETSEMQGLHNSSQALYLHTLPQPLFFFFDAQSPLSAFATNWLVRPCKKWMLRWEGGGKGKADTDPLGTTSGPLSGTTLWWPLKCLSRCNLNSGQQAQYPEHRKPELLHSWVPQCSLFTRGLDEDGQWATEER